MKKLLILVISCQFMVASYCNAQSNSAAALVGRNINVFPVDTIGYANIQVEEHISIDKTNPSNLVLSARTYDYSASSSSSESQGCYSSHDGGNTWSGNDYFPNSPTGTVHVNNVYTYTTSSVGGDPATAVDADGNMYVASMTFFDQNYSYSYLLNVIT